MTNAFLIMIITISLFSIIAINYYFGLKGIIALYIFFIFMSQILINIRANIFGLVLVIGSIMFASLSICIDLTSELYGKKEADNLINIGIVSLIMLFLFLFLVEMLVIEIDDNSLAYKLLFANQFRIIAADLLFSYFIFQKINVMIYDKIRKMTKDKHLWLRGVISTFVSQTLIAFAFYEFAFFGFWSQTTIFSVIFSGLILKYTFTILEIPVLYSSKFLNVRRSKSNIVVE